jgi:hypothetical protein
MGTGAIEALRASMHGAVIGPDDPDYGEARKVWNGYDPDNVFHRNANIKPAEAGVR